MRKPDIPFITLQHWHINYYQAGFSLQEIAEIFHTNHNPLSQQFRKHGLPIARRVPGRHWRPPPTDP